MVDRFAESLSSSSSSRKKTVIILRWLLIVSAWALYSSRPEMRLQVHGHVVFAISALSNLALMVLGEAWFKRTRFIFILLVADTLLASILVYGQGAGDYTLFLIFFLMILFSALASRTKQSCAFGWSIFRWRAHMDVAPLALGTLVRPATMSTRALTFRPRSISARRLHLFRR